MHVLPSLGKHASLGLDNRSNVVDYVRGVLSDFSL